MGEGGDRPGGSGQASGPHHPDALRDERIRVSSSTKTNAVSFHQSREEVIRIISSPALVYNDTGNLKHEIEKTKTTITKIITCLLPFLLSSSLTRNPFLYQVCFPLHGEAETGAPWERRPSSCGQVSHR